MQPLSNALIIKYRHLFTKWPKYIPFGAVAFIPAEWKIGHKVINKWTIVQILIVNTAFCIYDDLKVKEISILNSFEQIQENTRTGSAFSARQLGHAFHTRPIVHILSPGNWQLPFLNQRKGENDRRNISRSIFTEECCRPRRGLKPRPPGLQSVGASEQPRSAIRKFINAQSKG